MTFLEISEVSRYFCRLRYFFRPVFLEGEKIFFYIFLMIFWYMFLQIIRIFVDVYFSV